MRRLLVVLLVMPVLVTAPAALAQEDEFPGCEDLGGCATFEPPAALPGATVVVSVTEEVGSIPGTGECVPGADKTIHFVVDNVDRALPLIGSQELAEFVVPEIPPGEYVVAVFCVDSEIGFDAGSFTVLGVPNT